MITETLESRTMRFLSDTLMPNHWHFVLWPKNDGDLGRFMQRLTVTHVACWQKNDNMVGFGHVCQGRFKSFPVDCGSGSMGCQNIGACFPIGRLLGPRRWLQYVNQPDTEAELAALRNSSQCGTPYGSPAWVKKTVRRPNLQSTIRSPGRRKKR